MINCYNCKIVINFLISIQVKYFTKAKNWIDIETGEVFITDEKIKKFPEEIHLTKNYRELQKFFKDNSIIIPQKFPLKFDGQLPIF